MILLEIEQQSEEWFAAKVGIPSASGFEMIITTKGEPSKQAVDYMRQLAGERITGKQEESYEGAWMKRGKEIEEEARRLYELMKDAPVQRVGVCYRDEARRFCCSPDSLVGEDGGLEIKCPKIKTHVRYLEEGKLPTDYYQQVQGNLYVTGRKWWDFMSYYPGIKPLVVRVYRDEAFISALEAALLRFCDELDQLTRRIS